MQEDPEVEAPHRPLLSERSETPCCTRILHKARKLSFGAKVFVIVVCLKALTLICLNFYILVVGEGKKCFIKGTNEPVACPTTYYVNKAVMIIVFCMFQMYHAVSGTFDDNIYELYAAMASSTLLTVYAITRFAEPYDNTPPDYVFIVVTCVAQAIYLLLAYPLFIEFSHRLKKKIGDNVPLRRSAQNYLIFKALVKFYVMFAVFTILVTGDGVLNSGWRLGLDIAEFLETCIFVLTAYLGVVKQFYLAYLVFWMFSPVGVVYTLYWMVKSAIDFNNGAYDWAHGQLMRLFFVFGSFTLALHVVVVCFAIYIVIVRRMEIAQRKKDMSSRPQFDDLHNMFKPPTIRASTMS